MRSSHGLVTLQRIANSRQNGFLGLERESLRWLTIVPTKSPTHKADQSDGKLHVEQSRPLQNRSTNFNRNDRSRRNNFNQSARPRRRAAVKSPKAFPSLNLSPPSTSIPEINTDAVKGRSGLPTKDFSDLVETFTRLRLERDALDPLEAAPLAEVCSQLLPNPTPSHTPEYLQRCRNLFEDTVTWIDQVQQMGHTPGHSPSSELATLLGQSLSIFNKIPPAAAPDGKSIKSQCRRILDLLSKYNLNLRAFHYDCTIRVALREQDWQYAANLFWEQINPDGCNSPVSISVVDPVGLYAIARYTQQRGGAIADEVMDAVNQLTMIAPMDQDKYVLAAGTALGYVNAWESALNFFRTSLHSKQLGEPLVSATMHACIMSNQHREALNAFNERFGMSASGTVLPAWQVGGGTSFLSPLCRDLAMRATMDTDDPKACARALHFFQEAQKEKVAVSLEALLAVSRACETTGNWEDSVGVLFAVLNRSLVSGWIVSGYELSIVPIQQPDAKDATNPPWWIPGLVPVLGSTLRACNAASRFATALLCIRLFELSFLSPQAMVEEDKARAVGDREEDLNLTMFRVVAEMQHDDELLTAMMTSLCGLGWNNRAASLFTLSRNARGLDASNNSVVKFTRKNDPRSAECFLFAKSRSAATEPSSLDNIWGRIHRFTAAVQALELAGGIVPRNEELTVANELADLMQHCTSSGFPGVAICLARRTERLKLAGQKRSALAGMMMSFLGEEKVSFSDFLLSHDATLAQYIKSYSLNGWHDAAIGLFKSRVNVEKDTLSGWTSSCNAAIEALSVANRSSNALAIFRKLGAASNGETFNILGTALASKEQWEQVYDLFSYVGQNGLFTEELAFLAMQALVKTADQPMDKLRRIVADAAKNAAMPDMQWLQAKYWKLTSSLGAETSRHLMGWDDVDSALVGELALALDALEDNTLASGDEKVILWAIVLNSQAVVNQTDISNEVAGASRLPRDRKEWIELMLRVANTAKETGVLSDGGFFCELIRVFRALGGDREVEELVHYALSSGRKLDRQVLHEVRDATRELGRDSALVSDLEFLTLTVAQQ